MTLLGQVVLLRELVVAFYGSELVLLLGLALLLVGTAIGTLLAGARPARSPASPHGAFLAFALLLPATIVLARALRHLLGGTTGAYLEFPLQLAGTALVLLPCGLAGGLLFQRAAVAYVEGSRTLAAAYALECLGGLAGGLLATASLMAGLSNLAAGLLAALVAVGAALLPGPRPRGAPLLAIAALLALGLAAALALHPRLDRWLTAWNHPDLVALRDTPYGRVAVTRRAGQVVVFSNDALAYESEGTAAEEFVQVAALAAPSPRATLVLGGAVEGLVEELLAHRPERVDLVELDAALLAAVLPHLPERSGSALAAPGVRLHVADPRRFLASSASAERYDLILGGLPEPDSGSANRFYTREFFAACARRLAPDGVLAFRLRGAENLWTPALARRMASIHRALAAVFPSVLVLPGTTQLVLASPAPLPRDPEVLVARFAERGLAGRLVNPAYLRYLWTNDRVAEIAARLASTPAPENRDSRPICYQVTLQLWLARFYPELAQLDLAVLARAPGHLELAVGALAAIALGLALSRVRRRPVLRRALFVAAVGGLGMLLEGVLILAYQVRQGVLFQDLGLLLTLFMAGLGAGSWAAGRRFAAGATRRAGALLLLAAAALCGATAALVAAGFGSALAATSLLLFAAGAVTGALFGWASLAHPAHPAVATEQSSVVAPLYAADLVGGSLGSLAGTLFLLPMLGLPATALLLALGALALLVLL